MSDEPCQTCGGDGESRKVADSPHGCCTYAIKTPCPKCRRVVSVEEYETLVKLRDQVIKHTLDLPAANVVSKDDMENAQAIREIEAEGLVAHHYTLPTPGHWVVSDFKYDPYGPGKTTAGTGSTLPLAVAAYRAAKEKA